MRYILTLLFIVFYSSLFHAQSQNDSIAINLDEMITQMEEMMKDFPTDSIYIQGMENFQFGDMDFEQLGESMQGLMEKMGEAFKDIDLSGVQEEIEKMEEEFRRQLPNNQSEKDDTPTQKQQKKRKTTKL